jgi:hypothetical protein
MQSPRASNSQSNGGLIFGVLAAFALLVIAASGIGRAVVDPQQRHPATPTAVKAPESPTKSKQPADTANPQTAPATPSQSAPVNPSPSPGVQPKTVTPPAPPQ